MRARFGGAARVRLRLLRARAPSSKSPYPGEGRGPGPQARRCFGCAQWQLASRHCVRVSDQAGRLRLPRRYQGLANVLRAVSPPANVRRYRGVRACGPGPRPSPGYGFALILCKVVLRSGAAGLMDTPGRRFLDARVRPTTSQNGPPQRWGRTAIRPPLPLTPHSAPTPREPLLRRPRPCRRRGRRPGPCRAGHHRPARRAPPLQL